MENSKKVKSGFTIIEVVLVLAIAGLIFLMVFVALPALQRSQRDTQRRNDLARVATAITQFQTNNNGKLPTNANNSTFIEGYLGGADEFTDPDGTPYDISFETYVSGAAAKNDFENANTGHQITVYSPAYCSGETVGEASNDRAYAIVYKLEGTGTYCADNDGTPKTKTKTNTTNTEG